MKRLQQNKQIDIHKNTFLLKWQLLNKKRDSLLKVVRDKYSLKYTKEST